MFRRRVVKSGIHFGLKIQRLRTCGFDSRHADLNIFTILGWGKNMNLFITEIIVATCIIFLLSVMSSIEYQTNSNIPNYNDVNIKSIHLDEFCKNRGGVGYQQHNSKGLNTFYCKDGSHTHIE